MSGKRKCSGTTKAGKPCKANPIKGTDFCLSHSDAETRASVGFTAEAGKLGGRPKTPTVIDAIREEVERRMDEITGALWELANAAERAVVVGNGPDAHVEIVPDNDLRLKALRELLDRSHGRPKQATELTGAGGGPIQTTPPIPEDNEWHRQAIEAAHELGLTVPPSEEVAAHAANGNGNGKP